jgi:hypothetical protein
MCDPKRDLTTEEQLPAGVTISTRPLGYRTRSHTHTPAGTREEPIMDLIGHKTGTHKVTFTRPQTLCHPMADFE